jgi:hypothetical protein
MLYISVKGTKALNFSRHLRERERGRGRERDGAVMFNCAHEQTTKWLNSLITVLSIKDGLQLCVLGVDEQPKCH